MTGQLLNVDGGFHFVDRAKGKRFHDGEAKDTRNTNEKISRSARNENSLTYDGLSEAKPMRS